MSRGKLTRFVIKTSISSLAGALLAITPTAHLSAQNATRSAAETFASGTAMPDAVTTTAILPPIPEYQPADPAEPAATKTTSRKVNPTSARTTDQVEGVVSVQPYSLRSRQRRPPAQELRLPTEPAPAIKTAAAVDPPIRVAQADTPTAPPARLPARTSGSETRGGTLRRGTSQSGASRGGLLQGATLPGDEDRSGLLPEKSDDAILPPPDNYQISQEEAALLEQFLNKWEEFGKNIKKVACSVDSKEQGGGLYGEDKDAPLSHTFGEFKFVAPNKLLYHILGEFSYEKGEDGKVKPEYKKGVGEKKFILDGKSLIEYDFKNRVALVTPIPKEQQNKDLTMDGPIPIFFIAKAENLKRRFYMKLITKPDKQDSEVWIEAWPRQASDAQSFQRIIITLRLADLQPYYMRQYHTNGKSYTELWFYDISINKGLWNIEPKIDFGWKKEEVASSSVGFDAE
ncbi:MAG: hypothetical protein ACOX6D_05755 [Thermoguttaceae bacterium]|jgi:hypothetical protein